MSIPEPTTPKTSVGLQRNTRKHEAVNSKDDII